MTSHANIISMKGAKNAVGAVFRCRFASSSSCRAPVSNSSRFFSHRSYSSRIYSNSSAYSRSTPALLQQMRHFAKPSTRGEFHSTNMSKSEMHTPFKRLKAFLMDAHKIWGNTYDYSQVASKGICKGNHEVITVLCPKHNDFAFTTTPIKHIQRRQGCPICEKERGHTTVTLGQHFLVDDTVLDKLVAAANIKEPLQTANRRPTQVLELAAGTGNLTFRMARYPHVFVRAVEKDVEVFEILEKKAARIARIRAIHALPNLKIENECALKCVYPKNIDVAVGNLPYRVATGLMIRLLSHRPKIPRLVLLVQKEFADGLDSVPGDIKFCRNAAFLQGLDVKIGRPEGSKMIPPTAFQPPPRVDSSFLVLTQDPTVDDEVEPHELDSVLRIAFAHRDGDSKLSQALSWGDPIIFTPRAPKQALIEEAERLNMLNHICKDLSGKDYVRLIKNVLARRKESFSGMESSCPLERNVYTMPISTQDPDHLAKTDAGDGGGAAENSQSAADEKLYDPEDDFIPHSDLQILDGFAP